MRARLTPLVVALVVVAVLAAPAEALAETLSPGDVVERADELDGQNVTVRGEVIGDRLRGGAGHSWLNILGDGVAIGVWTPEEDTERVTTFGAYGQVGDIVEIEGEFHAACEQHGGDLDVHASTLTVVETGATYEETTEPWVVASAVASLVVALALIAVYRRRRHRFGEVR